MIEGLIVFSYINLPWSFLDAAASTRCVDFAIVTDRFFGQIKYVRAPASIPPVRFFS